MYYQIFCDSEKQQHTELPVIVRNDIVAQKFEEQIYSEHGDKTLLDWSIQKISERSQLKNKQNNMQILKRPIDNIAESKYIKKRQKVKQLL